MIKGEWVGLFVACSTAVSSKLATEVSRLKVNIKDLSTRDDGLLFSIKRQDKHLLDDIALTYGVEFLQYKLHGVSAVFNTIKLRAGLIIGVILGVVAIAILSNFTLGIKINCDRTVYYGKVEQTLQKSGLKCGIPLAKVDSRRLEDSILKEIDESVFVTVHTKGVVVYVDVVTVPLTDEYPKDKLSVKAEYEGIVTRVIVNSGTAIVKVGDSVKVGALLIDGYINTNKGDYQKPEEVVKVPVAASGEVYGKVFYHKRIFTAEQAVLTRRTGNQKTLRQLFIGKFPLGGLGKQPYELCESVTSKTVIDVLIPINVVTVTYFEIESYTLDKDAYKENCITLARAEIVEKLPQGAKVIKEQVLVSTQDANTIDFYIEVEQRIDDGGHNYSYAR